MGLGRMQGVDYILCSKSDTQAGVSAFLRGDAGVSFRNDIPKQNFKNKGNKLRVRSGVAATLSPRGLP